MFKVTVSGSSEDFELSSNSDDSVVGAGMTLAAKVAGFKVVVRRSDKVDMKVKSLVLSRLGRMFTASVSDKSISFVCGG